MVSIYEFRDLYLEKLGYKQKEIENKYRNSVYIRSAFMCACRGLYTTNKIGAAWDRDHSSVCYASQQHPVNLKFSKEYNLYYNIAKDLLKLQSDYSFKTEKIEEKSLPLYKENINLKVKITDLERQIQNCEDLIDFYRRRYGKEDRG